MESRENTQLEDKIKKFNQEAASAEEMEQLKNKIRNLHLENETLRSTFQKSYQELLDAFTSFKKQIEDDQIRQ